MSDIDKISGLVCNLAHIAELNPDDVIYDVGFTSMAALQLLIEMETEFDVTIPDDRFIAARTVRELYNLVDELREGVPA